MLSGAPIRACLRSLRLTRATSRHHDTGWSCSKRGCCCRLGSACCVDPTSKSRRYEAGGCAAGACVGVSGSAGVGAVDGCAAGRARPQQAVTTWNTLAKKTVRARVTAKAPRSTLMAASAPGNGPALPVLTTRRYGVCKNNWVTYLYHYY